MKPGKLCMLCTVAQCTGCKPLQTSGRPRQHNLQRHRTEGIFPLIGNRGHVEACSNTLHIKTREKSLHDLWCSIRLTEKNSYYECLFNCKLKKNPEMWFMSLSGTNIKSYLIYFCPVRYSHMSLCVSLEFNTHSKWVHEPSVVHEIWHVSSKTCDAHHRSRACRPWFSSCVGLCSAWFVLRWCSNYSSLHFKFLNGRMSPFSVFRIDRCFPLQYVLCHLFEKKGRFLLLEW